MTFGSGVFGSGLFGGAMSSGLSGVTYTIELAFSSTYSTPAVSRTWTDVTAYAAEGDAVVIGFARGDEFSTADANSLALTLDNTDGRFTPGNTSGAYYPNVKVGVPVRVTATVSGSQAIRFVGYVDEWPLEWPGGSQDYSVARVTARSRMARLGLSAPLGNLIYEEYRRDSPDAHYMLDSLADTVGGAPLAQRSSGTAVVFTGTGPGTDGISAATFAAGKYLSGPLASGTPSSEVVLSCFFATSTSYSGDPNWGVLCALSTAGSNQQLVLAINDSNQIQAAWYTTGAGDRTLSGSTTVTDGGVHHAAIKQTATATELYLDGLLVASDGSTTLAAYVDIAVGGVGYTRPDSGQGYTKLTGTVAHVATFIDAALSSTRIAAHAAAGLTGFAGETAEVRVDRYAAYAGVLVAETAVNGTAETPMAHIDTTGQAPLDLLRKVEQTDGGVLYDARDGTLTLAGRALRYNAATAATLQANQVETGVVPKLDRSALLNEVTATVSGGAEPPVRAIAQTSYNTYGPHKQDLELATTDPNEAHAAAWWKVNTYSEPRPRIPALKVALETLSAADQTLLLGLSVGSKVKVENWPSQAGTVYADGFFVEGYTETIGVGFHHLELNVSPATGFDVWTIEDAVLGQYDLYPLAY